MKSLRRIFDFRLKVAYDPSLDQYVAKRGEMVVFVGNRQECEDFLATHAMGVSKRHLH